MRQNKNGCIIIVGSVSGKMAISPLGAYAASKFAVEALSEALAQEVKPFNIRVAVLEPGIINTQMAGDISVEGNSIYPQSRRNAAVYIESLKQPTPPTLVADTMLEIANGSSWQLKYPVGPDAAPFLGWRASMTDEQQIDWNAQNDEDWFNAVEATFGMNVRREKQFYKMLLEKAQTHNIGIAASGTGRYKISHLQQYLPVVRIQSKPLMEYNYEG